MANLTLSNLTATLSSFFRIGGSSGIRLKNNSGALDVRNAGDSAYANLHAAALDLETSLAIADGGTGQTTQQAAINALTAVSAATVGHALVKKSNGDAGYEAVSATFPEYTWAGKPAAASNSGKYIRITDIGINGSLWRSDGANWLPVDNRVLLFQQQLPIILPYTVTPTTNGAFTISTGSLSISNRQVYIYFPANSIGSGVPAGFYYCEMTSSSAGTAYNNVYTPGTGLPEKPTSNIPFTGTTGTTANTTAEITLINVPIPSGLLSRGKLKFNIYTFNATYYAMTYLKLGATTVRSLTAGFASTFFVHSGEILPNASTTVATSILATAAVQTETTIDAATATSVIITMAPYSAQAGAVLGFSLEYLP